MVTTWRVRTHRDFAPLPAGTRSSATRSTILAATTSGVRVRGEFRSSGDWLFPLASSIHTASWCGQVCRHVEHLTLIRRLPRKLEIHPRPFQSLHIAAERSRATIEVVQLLANGVDHASHSRPLSGHLVKAIERRLGSGGQTLRRLDPHDG